MNSISTSSILLNECILHSTGKDSINENGEECSKKIFFPLRVKPLLNSFSSQDSSPNLIEKLHQGTQNSKKLLRACRKRPSYEKVRNIVEKHPESLQAMNSRRQTPLHVACAKAAHPEVIIYLVVQFREACSMEDDKGKYPLHYVASPSNWFKVASDSSMGIFESVFLKESSSLSSDSSSPRNPLDPLEQLLWYQYRRMLEIFCKTDPKPSILRDNTGMSPVMYAVKDKAPMDVIRTLQCAAVSQRRCHADRVKNE